MTLTPEGISQVMSYLWVLVMSAFGWFLKKKFDHLEDTYTKQEVNDQIDIKISPVLVQLASTQKLLQELVQDNKDLMQKTAAKDDQFTLALTDFKESIHTAIAHLNTTVAVLHAKIETQHN
ncbi:hypothetical protein [Pseudoalteromonas phage J2-1_QLiu-2017]|nr:hypothetical protein [Pseudoalteromonas phage J2-1_QLiu-2017]